MFIFVNGIDFPCLLFFSLEVHEIMDVLDKFDGDEDPTLILPEDGEQTDEESGDEVDRVMNHIPPRSRISYIEVYLKSNYYNFEKPDEKDTSTPHVSKKHDSSFPSRRMKPKTVALEPGKWSYCEIVFIGRPGRGD